MVECNLDSETLQALRTGAARSVSLELFSDAPTRIDMDDVSVGDAGQLIGWGHVPGDTPATFAFVSRDGLFLSVLHDGHGTTEIATQPGGRITVHPVDETALPYARCATSVSMMELPVPHGGTSCPHGTSKLANYAADDGGTVDIMFVYTAAARDAAGGVVQIESRMDLAVADANAAYQRSTINPRLRIVRKALIAYTETGVGLTDLPRLSTPGDGFLDSVHADRDTYGADLVHLWVSNLNAGGVAWSMAGLPVSDYHTSGFCVMRQDNYNLLTLAHEAGHNFGCDHDRANTAGGALYPYSYGYREPGGVWKDIMAYPPGTTIPYFSNPNLNYTGTPPPDLGNHGPMGVPGENPSSSCDNVRTHNNTAWWLANYRPETLSPAPPARLYVNAAAASGGTGSSWGAAINDLQLAIGKAVASRGIVTEVWVAAGTYKPDRGRNDRGMSFRLAEGVTIYGGFAGGETLLSQRNVATNVTTLSGDIGAAGDPSDNSLHLLDLTDLNATAVLDGFTVTGGNANGAYPNDSGGGVFAQCTTATINNCKFTANNAAFGGGAGLHFNGGNPTYNNCTFQSNTAGDSGGAFQTDNSDPEYNTCTFTQNVAPNGAAISERNNSNAIYDGCTFSSQTSANWSGAYQAINSSPAFTNCTFSANACVNAGGAMGLYTGGTAVLTGCQFNTNSAGFAGAIYCLDNANAQITNCTFTNNSAPTAGAIYCFSASPSISGCTFTGNQAPSNGAGGAIGVTTGSAPTVLNCTFNQNNAACCGGAIVNFGCAPVVRLCTFVANTANFGAGVYNTDLGTAVYDGDRFFGNIAQFSGGAFQNSNGSNATIVNCVMSGNSAPQGNGGAIHNDTGTNMTIVNCTVNNNTAAFSGGGILNNNASPAIANSLLWANNDSGGTNLAAQIRNFGSSSPAVNYCSVQGGPGSLGGTGNNGSNPNFVDANGADNVYGTIDDNLNLQAESPAMDAANKTLVPAGITTDAAGNPRFVNVPCLTDTGVGTAPLPDRGAYEYQPLAAVLGDFNASGTVTPADVSGMIAVLLGSDTDPAHVAAADMNCDGAANGRDIRGFVSAIVGP